MALTVDNNILPDLFVKAILKRLREDAEYVERMYASGMWPRPKPPTPEQVEAARKRARREELALRIAPWLAPEEDY
jgi:hypothetical protein